MLVLLPMRLSSLLILAFACLVFAAGTRAQTDAPAGGWKRHDMSRPRPPVANPPPAGDPVPAPADAIVLFDGTHLDDWIAKLSRGPGKGKIVKPDWKVEDGHMEAAPNSGTLISKERFGDCQLHVEWATPAVVVGQGQARGNSGVLLQGLCEVQILDSYENDTYPDGQAGSIYSTYPPLVNVSRKPGEWQSFDITLQTARLDKDGNVTEPARITVFHNGVLIHPAVTLESKTQIIGLALQDHLNPVRFRNIWLRRLPGTGNPAAEAAGGAKPAASPAPVPGPAKASADTHPFIAPPATADAGSHLLSTLNCSSCHAATGVPPERFPAKKAPHLGLNGLRYTAQYLQDYLMAPQQERPGTTMPDMLHGYDPTEKAAVVDRLVHFLMEQNPPDQEAPAGEARTIARGRQLYHEIGCVACHAPYDPPAGSSAMPDLAATSVPMGKLAKKYSLPQLAAFLTDPSKYRPQRLMPSLHLNKAEADAIAMYLLEEQTFAPLDAKKGGRKIAGLRFELFDGEFKDCGPSLSKREPSSAGSIGEINLEQWTTEGQPFAVRFTGQMEVPVDGTYNFYARSTDGSRLSIGGREVVDNDGKHPQREKQGTVELKAGSHEFVLTSFQSQGGKGSLTALFDGPGIRKRPIKAQNVSHIAPSMRPLGEAPFQVDAAKAKQGRVAFGRLGCAQCHPSSGITNIPAASFAAVKLLQLKPESATGCLSASPGKEAPQFQLSAEQRETLQKALQDASKLARELTPRQEIARVMSLMNCYACHSREGAGGPPSARAAYFQSSGEIDLGDEGRLPPHLNGVGAKLNRAWLENVLLRHGTARPHMATRMPGYGSIVAGLPDLFVKTDATSPEPTAAPYDTETAKAGHALVGLTGYTCIACHSFDKHKSLGIPAVDLSAMTKRLRQDWFENFLVDPPAQKPGTRMPSFWPQGHAANRTILNGDTAKQTAAIWMYLSKGSQAEPPQGIVQAMMEVVANREPVIYRNFIEGAGPRAIGVGYPEKVNLAFDAEQIRLALLWRDAFIDASKHRSGRGGGFQPPLGAGLYKLPQGAPFAVLKDASAPWPAESGMESHFHGYRYEAQRRPYFRYAWQGIEVEDHYTPLPAAEGGGLRRTLELRATQAVEGLHFRAALGTIETQKDGAYLVDGKIRLRFEQAAPIIRGQGSKSELLVPVTFQNNQARLVEVFSW